MVSYSAPRTPERKINSYREGNSPYVQKSVEISRGVPNTKIEIEG